MPLTKLQKYWFTVVQKEPHTTSRYYEEISFVCIELRGVLSSQDLREAFLQNCDFVIENHVENILVDFSRMGMPDLNDQIWIANHATEQLKDSNIKRIATVQGPELFQHIFIQTSNGHETDEPLTCVPRDFLQKEEALAWLFPKCFQ